MYYTVFPEKIPGHTGQAKNAGAAVVGGDPRIADRVTWAIYLRWPKVTPIVAASMMVRIIVLALFCRSLITQFLELYDGNAASQPTHVKP